MKAVAAGGSRGWPLSFSKDQKTQGVALRRRRVLKGALRTLWPYLVLLILVVGLSAVVAAPLSGGLVQRWSENDARSRSRLIDRTVGPILTQALAAADWPRVSAIFADAAE